MKNFILSIQILVVAFGSMILGPIISGLDISLSLFSAGVCTIFFHLITNRKVPFFTGGSLSVLSSAILIISSYGLAAFFGASLVCSILYILIGILFMDLDKKILDMFLPTSIRGSVVVLIGFTLISVATSKMTSFTGATFQWSAVLVSVVTVATLLFFSNYGGKFTSIVSVIIAMLVGYILTLIVNPDVINMASPLENAKWFQLPWVSAIQNNAYALPFVFNLNAILMLFPLFLTTVAGHIGSIFVISEVSGENFVEKPGISKSCVSLGLSNALSSFLGGLPIVEYAEVIGTVTTTKEYNPVIVEIAALLAIAISFFGKFNILLSTIPTPVMGGIMFVLFGGIGMVGVKILTSTANLENKRELIVSTVMLSSGIGNFQMIFSDSFKFEGIGLAVMLGIATNLILLFVENKERIFKAIFKKSK
jgi:uracil permease